MSNNVRCEEWRQQGLVEHFCEHDRKMPDRCFAFILGAGASITSGIPAAGKLARRWIEQLYTRHAPSGTLIESWATAENLGIEKFSWNDVAESYCHIYKRRFMHDPDEGFADLEEQMLGKKPGCGYAILAYILASTRHNLVITTNFDNLMQDAMFMYTNSVPNVFGHETLAPFFRAKSRRPTIIKIHRDLLMAPMSQSDELQELQAAWRDPLAQAFHNFTSIVIGYGGNDKSLMGYLESMSPQQLRGRLFWCYHAPSGPPRNEIREVVSKLNGVLVALEDNGFDGLMMAIQKRMSYPSIEAISDARLTELRNHAAGIVPMMGTSSTGLTSVKPDELLVASPDFTPPHAVSECQPCEPAALANSSAEGEINE